MSEAANSPQEKNIIQRPIPVWLAATIVGIVLGGGTTFQTMRLVGYEYKDPNKVDEPSEEMKAMVGKMAGGAGMPGGAGPGGGMMGGGMMGMMGGGMGGGGGPGGAREKRSLTALVGKLDLLSSGLHFELDPEQSEKVAAKLAELDQAEKMSGEEAQEHLDALEQVLTEEQKATLAAIELPRGRAGAGGGMGGPPSMGSGGPGGGGMGGPPSTAPGGPGGGMPSGGGFPSGPPPDENPFQQEANQKRLRDLLLRLKPSPAEATPASDETTPASDEAAPASDEAAPASDEAAPASDEAAPASDEAAPASDEAAPASSAETTPQTDETERTTPENEDGTESSAP